MLRQSENIVHRLFNREIARPRPNTNIHQARTLYENIVPSHTIYDIESPDQTIRKFTNDGQFLICFGRNHQDLIVYRHKWLNFCVKGEDSDLLLDLPPETKRFDSHFSLLYTISLATGTEAICEDFFLSTENGLYGIFATSTVPVNYIPATDGAVPGVPSIETTTIFIISLAEGHITDERSYRDDFIHLAHNMGVFLYDDLLAVLSIRFQCIRILQIRETGRFIDVRTIGKQCREDDELVLNSQALEEESYHKQQASLRKAGGLSQHDASVSGRFVEQGKPWLPLWNHKRRQSTTRKRNGKQALSSAHGTNGAASDLGLRLENGDGHGDRAGTEANGNHNDVQVTDLDLQYENYFRGLLPTLQDTAVNEIDGHVASNGYESTFNAQGAMNLSRQRSGIGLPGLNSRSLAASSNGGGDAQQNDIGSGQFFAERTRTPLQTPAWRHNSGGVELSTADATVETVHNSVRTGRNSEGSTSESGGQYSSAGPSRHRRSYTSTTGSSLDRHTGGRGSSSASTSSSVSRDVSFSGVSMSYGNGRAGAHGSVSVRSDNGNIVEYVVSSRMQAAGTVTTQQIPSEEQCPVPSSSSQGPSERGLSERRSFDSNLRENGHSHVNTHEPNSDDRTLPLRPAERSNSLTNRADGQIGAARLAQISVREGNNDGNRGRPPRDGGNGADGTVQRNRPIADLATDSNEGGAHLLGGIKQRLLSFIYQIIVNEEISPLAKAKKLKRFYYHFPHYVDLVIWKVQFLDRHHLLIKFGSVDGMLQRNPETSHQTAFFAIFNLETTEILGFYQNSTEEILLSFEQLCDHFRVAARYPLYMNFISSYSNNTHVREQLRQQRMACSSGKTGNYLQFVKKTLAWIPFNSQCYSPSAYYDQSLFHYDEELISAIDRHKSCVEHPVKFISRRRPNCLKFKLSPGPEHGARDGRTKRVASFIFHPIFPFAISIQESFMQTSVINFHFRK